MILFNVWIVAHIFKQSRLERMIVNVKRDRNSGVKNGGEKRELVREVPTLAPFSHRQVCSVCATGIK